jgi:hypothetical protein
MLQKFLHGLAFGTGLAIALFVVWVGGSLFVVPALFESGFSETRDIPAEPALSNPKVADLQPQLESGALVKPDYRIFNRAGRPGNAIPEGGGILGISVLPTELGAERPRTFQLWLTETELWKIRTEGTNVEIERDNYPTSTAETDMHRVLFERIGRGADQSTMSVSRTTVDAIKRGEPCDDDDHLNGEFRITTEGVLLMMPNPIKR